MPNGLLQGGLFEPVANQHELQPTMRSVPDGRALLERGQGDGVLAVESDGAQQQISTPPGTGKRSRCTLGLDNELAGLRRYTSKVSYGCWPGILLALPPYLLMTHMN